MSLPNKSQTNRLLGYPADARLLIINADDFGMCHAVNEAITQTLLLGVVHSTTLLVPAPWALQAIHFLRDHPEISFGVHLTAIGDSADYSWRPVTSREKIPSLVNPAGYFHTRKGFPEFLDRVNLDQLEMEFRAQIDAVLAAGLKPTHLDWHSLRIGGRTDIFELMFRLAKEYGLALRVMGRSFIETVQRQDLPVNDFDFLDSYGLDPVTKFVEYTRMLHELPPGLTEWAVHPGLDGAELLAIEPNGRHVRQADYDYLMSQAVKDIIKEEGIILLDYSLLQTVWKK